MRQWVHLHNEVLLEEQEANNGKEVHEDEGQQRRQQDGAPVAGDAFYDIEQGLLTVDQVKELPERFRWLGMTAKQGWAVLQPAGPCWILDLGEGATRWCRK